MKRILRPERRTSVLLGRVAGSTSDMPALSRVSSAPDLLSNLILSMDLEEAGGGDGVDSTANTYTAQTAAITTGVRHGTNNWTIGALDSATRQYAKVRVAALRMWRGTGVINQIVNNSAALTFLTGQQRRHSELT